MRWAPRLLQSTRPSRSPARRARLGVQALEGRAVPSATMGPDPTSNVVPVEAKPQAPFPQIGDRVWKDLNGDGLQDPGEPGIAGVTLQLYQGTKLVGTTVTDGQGAYAFNCWNVTNGTTDTADDGLVAGTAYEIRVAGNQSALVGQRPTASNAGTDDFHDSDAVAGAAGTTLDFTMGPSELYSNYDLGYSAAASIGSVVWADANNNGVKDTNEAGLPGVSVRLLDVTGTHEVATTTTGADGSYLFTALVPGTYIVEIAQANFAAGAALSGYASSTGATGQATGPFEGAKTPDPNGGKPGIYDHGTTTDSVIRARPVAVMDSTLDNHMTAFGFIRSGTLAGKVFVDVNANGRVDLEDSAGVAGVKVTAAGPAGVFTTTTDASGTYSFVDLPAGTYTVTEAQPGGYKSSTPDLATAAVGPAAPAAVNFGEARTVDLSVRMAARTVATVGDVLLLTYRVKNLGTQDASGITLNAPLTAGLKVLSVTQTGGTYDKVGHRASILTLAPGAEAVFTIRVRATAAGVYRLSGIVQGTQSEDQVGNNRSAAVIRVSAVPPPPPPALPTSVMLASMFWR
jgi:uncharacterized repeat protein (TIGR01451 family)